MDAVKFLKEYYRLCNSYLNTNVSDTCTGCPFWTNHIPCSLDEYKCEEADKIVSVVEQWSKENPAKTYKNDFLKKFPKTTYPEENLYKHNRWCDLYNYGHCDKGDGISCDKCWDMEMKDD